MLGWVLAPRRLGTPPCAQTEAGGDCGSTSPPTPSPASPFCPFAGRLPGAEVGGGRRGLGPSESLGFCSLEIWIETFLTALLGGDLGCLDARPSFTKDRGLWVSSLSQVYLPEANSALSPEETATEQVCQPEKIKCLQGNITKRSVVSGNNPRSAAAWGCGSVDRHGFESKLL